MPTNWAGILLRVFIYGGVILFSLFRAQEWLSTDKFNGFDVSDSLVPVEQIQAGGPLKDGIPSIDRPLFVPADIAFANKPDERVLGIYLNGIARAYPISILDWHEVVNDNFDGQPVVVSYCPLCGTGMAFRSDVDRGFGVSGLLFNSDMLLYDRKTDSLWSQIMATAISGPRKGDKLAAIPLEHTDWQSWKRQYPKTVILSRDTGFSRDYDQSPYLGYGLNERLFFPTANQDQRYANKENVIALKLGGAEKVWPFSELKKVGSPVTDSVGDQQLQVFYDAVADRAWITDETGKLLPAVRGYWFAWMAFYPDSSVFEAD